MDTVDIKIPADAKMVTLALERAGGFTLRSLLPQIRATVELVVVDEFAKAAHENAIDHYRLRANNGKQLLEKLERSRVVQGQMLLGLTPKVGLCTRPGDADYIELAVNPFWKEAS